MKRTPTWLHRASAIVCACILVSGVLAGCSPKKSGPTVLPSVAPTYPAPYAHSTKLAANLAALKQASGPIVGTMTVDSTPRPLTGLVSIKNGATRVRMLEGDPTTYISDEIVVGGQRYTSPDDNLWIDRGRKAVGSSLVKALASADTSTDSGIGTVTGISAHKIVTPADVVDVAPALGIDTGTFDEETTTLRIWADDAGTPIGFGASMGWKVTLGGQTETIAIDFNVMFAAESSADSPVDIVAPAKAWQWHEDLPGGIAYGYPGMLATVDSTVNTQDESAATKSLSQITKEWVDALPNAPGGAQSIVMGGEEATWMSVTLTAKKQYVVVAIVLHETIGYAIMVTGNPADHAQLDVQALQIFSTVEFTR